MKKFTLLPAILSALPLLFMIATLSQPKLVEQSYSELITNDSQKRFENSWLDLAMFAEFAHHSKNYRIAANYYLELYKLTGNLDFLSRLISSYIASKDLKSALLFLDEHLDNQNSDDLLALKLALTFKYEILNKDSGVNLEFNFHTIIDEKKVVSYLQMLNFTPSEYLMVINIFRRERESISIEKPDEFLLYLMLAGNLWQEAQSQIKKFEGFGMLQSNSVDIIFREQLKKGSAATLLEWVEFLERKHGIKPQFLMMKTEIYRNQKKKNLVINTLRKAVKAFPNNNQLIFWRAVHLFNYNLLDEASKDLESLLAFGYRQSEVHFFLGAIAEAGGQYADAIEHLMSITSSESEMYFIAQKKIAQLKFASKQFGKALELLDSLQMDFPDKFVEIIQFEADLLIENDEFELAMTVLNDSLSKLDFNRDLIYTRALVADRLGEIELVENDLRKILSLFPNDADALNALGYSLTNFTSRYEEAYQLIRRALELKSDSFYILDSMGWVYFKLGDLRSSIFYLEKAYELSQDEEITQHLVEVLNANGEFEKARLILEKS